MCQISVVVEREGKDGKEKVMEGVSSLEVTKAGIVLSALFEDPVVVPDAYIRKIDFQGGLVTLASLNAS
jgi:predicted RNA-binding protein